MRSRKKGNTTVNEFPLVHNYVIDALTGALVAELPRTPTIAVGTGKGLDELGKMKTFGIEFTRGKRAMRNANESYSDIFGTIISNYAEPNIAKWDWKIGDGICNGLEALRSMQDPELGQPKQPKLMKNFSNPLSRRKDVGGVHVNSGIHNFAASNVMSATHGRAHVFEPAELAAIFHIALTQQLSRQSTFADSRRGVVLATRTVP